jgi:hypothetical protein
MPLSRIIPSRCRGDISRQDRLNLDIRSVGFVPPLQTIPFRSNVWATTSESLMLGATTCIAGSQGNALRCDLSHSVRVHPETRPQRLRRNDAVCLRADCRGIDSRPRVARRAKSQTNRMSLRQLRTKHDEGRMDEFKQVSDRAETITELLNKVNR